MESVCERITPSSTVNSFINHFLTNLTNFTATANCFLRIVPLEHAYSQVQNTLCYRIVFKTISGCQSKNGIVYKVSLW